MVAISFPPQSPKYMIALSPKENLRTGQVLFPSLIRVFPVSGSTEFSLLKAKYAPLIRSLVRSFEGADEEEYIREAESALLKAAVRFDIKQSDVAFGLYAKICMRNALISLRRKEMSKKRRAERKVSEVRHRKSCGLYAAASA